MALTPYVFADQFLAVAPGTSHIPGVTDIVCYELASGEDPSTFDTQPALSALQAMKFPWQSLPERRGVTDFRSAPTLPAGEFRFYFEDPLALYDGGHVYHRLALLVIERDPQDEVMKGTGTGGNFYIPPWGDRDFDARVGGKPPQGTRLWAHIFESYWTNMWYRWIDLTFPTATTLVGALLYAPYVYFGSGVVDNNAAYQRAIHASHGTAGGYWLVDG